MTETTVTPAPGACATDKPNRKQAQEPSRHFAREDVHWATKHASGNAAYEAWDATMHPAGSDTQGGSRQLQDTHARLNGSGNLLTPSEKPRGLVT